MKFGVILSLLLIMDVKTEDLKVAETLKATLVLESKSVKVQEDTDVGKNEEQASGSNREINIDHQPKSSVHDDYIDLHRTVGFVCYDDINMVEDCFEGGSVPDLQYWTMSEKEKQRFHEMAEQDKRRFDLEMQNYVPPKDIKVRGRKRQQMKDPNAPKRSLSAFFWFCNEERSKVKANNPEYTMGDIAKELGRRWAAADPETKSKYEGLSERDKARYDREMTAYKKGVPLALTQPQEAPPLESIEADHENDSDFGGDFEGDEEYK